LYVTKNCLSNASHPTPISRPCQATESHGTAQVQAVVKPDGTAKEVKTVGAHPLLVDALARAVKQWKYQRAPNETVELVKFSFTPQ
jgi:hypothetical protein